MNGSKLLIVGVLLGFAGGIAAAVGMKLARNQGAVETAAGRGAGTPTAIAAVTTPDARPPDTPAPSSPEGTPGGVPTPFDLGNTTPRPSPVMPPVPGVTRRGAPTPASKVAMVRPTPRNDDDAILELPVEGPPAQIVFSKGDGGTAITRILEERHADTSIVRVELSGKARYKILQLPKRHELWIDFEAVEIPGGERSATGSRVHVDEVRARTYAEGTVARVTVRLANEGKFSVFPSKGTGEADGMLEVMLGP